MRTALLEKTAEWADKPNNLRLFSGVVPPNPHTATFAFVFHGSNLLTVDVRKRGWDIVGGHIENGETALDAVVRETHEEAGLSLSPSAFAPVGWTELTVHAPKPENYRYPYPLTVQPFWVADVERSHTLTTNVPDEIGAVAWATYDHAAREFAHKDWWTLLDAEWNKRR